MTYNSKWIEALVDLINTGYAFNEAVFTVSTMFNLNMRDQAAMVEVFVLTFIDTNYNKTDDKLEF